MTSFKVEGQFFSGEQVHVKKLWKYFFIKGFALTIDRY